MLIFFTRQVLIAKVNSSTTTRENKMKITNTIINAFEKLDEIKLNQLQYGATVKIKTFTTVDDGVVTRSPYFIVEHIGGEHRSIEMAAGVWWIDINKIRYSLEDYNVIPNSYNEHSMIPFDAEQENKKKALIAKANELIEQAKNM